MAPVIHNVDKWLLENEKYFVPPICNKLMYQDGQLKCFFVGGPNTRKDFHMEEGEEFFYMLKGDMKLVIVEKGKFKDVIIKEGEVFLLPARIPHSPQRVTSTTGLVIEREREQHEMDCLRYYVESSTEILYERWFHCDSLDSQLPPIIREYFNSEQYKTGKPIPGTILEEKPVQQDFSTSVETPFSLGSWLNAHKGELRYTGKKALFDNRYESRVIVFSRGEHSQSKDKPETFLWQLAGKACLSNQGQKYDLEQNHTMLINEGETWQLRNEDEGITLSVVMNPK